MNRLMSPLLPVSRRLSGLRKLSLVGLAMVNVALLSMPAYSITAYELDVRRDAPQYYWTFNEASGNALSQINNSAANAMVPFGTASRVSHGSIGSGLNLGNAASFTGASGGRFQAANLDGANTDFIRSQHWALEFWVQAQGANAGSRGDYLFESGSNNPAVIYDFNHGGGDTNQLEFFSPSGRSGGQGAVINDQGWHHVVMAFYGNDQGFGLAGRQEIYIDGALNSTITGTNFSSGFGLVQLAIGNAVSPNENAFEGRIDEVALYDIGAMLSANPASGNRGNVALISQMQTIVQGIAGHASAGAEETTQKILQGVSYQYAPGSVLPAGGPYADSTGFELTDGIISPSASNSIQTGEFVGFNDGSGSPAFNSPDIIFDLGQSESISEIWIDYIGAGGRAGITAPDAMNVLVSNDGFNFTLVNTFTNFNDMGDNANYFTRRLVGDLDDVSGRFFRLQFSNTSEWTFLTEVTFVTSAVVPEPASFALLGLGSLALLARRRRALA